MLRPGAERRRTADAGRTPATSRQSQHGDHTGLSSQSSANRTGAPVIVVDASAILELLLNTEEAQRIVERILAEGETLHAPHLLDLEVAQVLCRYSAGGELDPQRGQEALQDFLDFPISRYPHDVFLPRIWELRNNMTAYDAAYVALAEALGAPFVTRDAALASSIGHHVHIELI